MALLRGGSFALVGSVLGDDVAESRGQRRRSLVAGAPAPLLARIDGTPVSLDAIAIGSRVELMASWPPEDAQSYVWFDRASQTLSSRRESMHVSWFATGGQFETESTGRAEDDSSTSSANVWTAPPAATEITLWIILRDARGGVDFATYRVVVGG